MKLKLKHCEGMGDWYTIVKAEHDGIEEFRRTGPNTMSLYCSERVSDACVEGYLHEMADLAKAIDERGEQSFKRCAVAVDEKHDRVEFWSPRNSREPGVVTLADADDLAEQIREAVANPPHDAPRP